MKLRKTTPEDVVNAVGALIVYMADSGRSTDELAIILAAYTKLIIRQKRDTYQSAVVVEVSPEAFAMVEDLCRRTGRSRTDIASQLIEWAHERVEVRPDDGEE